MAKIISLRDLPALDSQQREWAYNAFDVMVPFEICEVLEPRLTPITRRIYDFEMGCQSPAMAMQLRGFRIDRERHKGVCRALATEIAQLTRKCMKLAVYEGWDEKEKETGKCKSRPGKRHKWPRGEADETRKCEMCGKARMQPKRFNPMSGPQTEILLHKLMGIRRRKNTKGQYSVDKTVLELIRDGEPKAREICEIILSTRHADKVHGSLVNAVSANGRVYTSFNVGATVDARWSSSANCYKEGTNLQNLPEKVRHIFVADPGWKLFYVDLRQAESLCLAYLAEDEAYIEAHLKGNVHVNAARVMFPDLPWTGDDKKDREICDQPAPWDAGGLSYYRKSKECQHAMNYGLEPAGLARRIKVKQVRAREIHENYFQTYPRLNVYHDAKAEMLKDTAVMLTPLGRRRKFFGRYWDGHTKKQAIAAEPQSMVAEITNAALWAIWDELDPERVQLFIQAHDGIVGQVREGDDEALAKVKDAMEMEVEINGRVMVIPADMEVGDNWGPWSESNPGGLEEWVG